MSKPEDLFKCYLCHKSMLKDTIIDGKEVKVFHPERIQTEFFINNGSRMPVSLCMSCHKKDLNDPAIHQEIMQNVIDAWQIEQNMLLERGETTQEQADACMDIHKKIAIDFHCHGMSDEQIKMRSLK